MKSPIDLAIARRIDRRWTMANPARGSADIGTTSSSDAEFRLNGD